MNCTITTDASFSNKYGVGTYAFWIISNLGRHTKSGVLRTTSASASQAEMKCICNALYFISQKKDVMEKVKRIFINTDSMNAIHLFTQDTKAIQRWGLKKKSYKNIYQRYAIIAKAFEGKQIEYNHIKAHKSTSTPATWVNDWCDRAAKAEMNKKIISILTKQKK